MSPGLPGPALVLGLLALLLPGTCSDCGLLPKLNHAIPSDMDRLEGFPVDTQVTYRCHDGFVKIPGKSDTVVCLSNSQWSNINEFCGHSCSVPTRLKFAALSKEDERKNYYPAGITVRYTCRPGYENITEMLLVSTCLENLTWSEAPEFCRRKSCGHPGELLHGRAVSITEFLYGAKIDFLCEDGYKLIGRPFIHCVLKGDEVEWSELPTCQGSCDVPTSLKFAVLSKEDERKNYYPAGITVRYTCRPGYENITEMLLLSTCLENLTWSEAPEFCRRKSCGHPGELLHGRAVGITEFLFGAKIDFLCEDGYKLIGRPFIHCVLKGDEVEWSELPTCQVITCSSPPYIANGTYDGRGVENFAYNSTVTYRCDRGFQFIGAASIHCTTKDKTSGIWSGPAPECKGSYKASNNTVLEQHKKKKIKSRPYYVSQFQNKPFTITSFRSSSFPRGDLRTRGSWITPPLFRFAVPLYINQSYCSVRTKERSICHQSYMGISGVLPSATCFQNLKWSEVPGFCGNSCSP